jgi:hypothetical protein
MLFCIVAAKTTFMPAYQKLHAAINLPKLTKF